MVFEHGCNFEQLARARIFMHLLTTAARQKTQDASCSVHALWLEYHFIILAGGSRGDDVLGWGR